jgi:hypothetical protein
VHAPRLRTSSNLQLTFDFLSFNLANYVYVSMPIMGVGKYEHGVGTPKKRRIDRQHLLFLAFIAPNFLLLGLFAYWPMLYQTYLSLTRWDMLAPRKTFVGLDNYTSMFGGREFWGVLFNTFYFMGVVVAGSVVLGLAIAILLNQRLRGRNLVRSVYQGELWRSPIGGTSSELPNWGT